MGNFPKCLLSHPSPNIRDVKLSFFPYFTSLKEYFQDNVSDAGSNLQIWPETVVQWKTKMKQDVHENYDSAAARRL